MDYKAMKIEDIINWCKENNQVAWLKQIAAKQYPVVDEEGNETGTRNITFIELKIAFAKKFMPDILPKAKDKKPTMFDLIKNL